MKTTYFDRYFKFRNEHPNPIAITMSISSHIIERGFTGKHMRSLGPDFPLWSDYKKKLITDEEYTVRYLNLLRQRKISPQLLLETLPQDATLICYEPVGEFCHRRVLAKWIEDHTGVVVPEWKTPEQHRKDQLVDDLLAF